ncbi:MAG: thiamine-phosphate kinase [Proteobacteria bacterium]|nr:thiamine-phosphate kinase [Pseudomonadota bacterium]
MDEAAIIERFFLHLGAVRTDVALGIGDDAALLRAPPGFDLVQTTDSLVENVHFLPGSPARSLGHRALAVSLSDLAAMGATPAWALLSLALPAIDTDWLGEFATGLGKLAREHRVALVGGNLSRGPLNVTLQMTGFVPAGTALRRSGAHAGDEVWISGTLGDAARGRLAPGNAAGGAAGGACADEQAAWLRARFEYPTPRVALGDALRGVATACIDLSDGLLADLPRLAAASGCGAVLDVDQLPLSAQLLAAQGAGAWQDALLGGEDYELCFTAPPAAAPAVAGIGARCSVALSRCGSLRAQGGLELRRGGDVIQFSHSPFGHFPA